MNQKEIATLAKKVEDAISHDMTLEDSYAFGLSDGSEVPVLMAECGDVYDLLDDPMTPATLDLFGHVIIVSHGWAQDVTDFKSPPVRVRLLVAVSRNGARSSVVRFMDSDNVLYDEQGEGNGALADAILALCKNGE